MVVQGADARPVAVARAKANSRALVCGRVVMAPGLWASDGASLLLRGVIVGADCPPGLPGASLCRFNVLGGFASP